MRSIKTLLCLFLCMVMCAGFVLPAAALVYDIQFIFGDVPFITDSAAGNNAVAEALTITASALGETKTYHADGYSIVGSDDSITVTNTGLNCDVIGPTFFLLKHTGGSDYEQVGDFATWNDTQTNEIVTLQKGESETIPVQAMMDHYKSIVKKSANYLLAVTIMGINGENTDVSVDRICLYRIDDAAAQAIKDYPFADVGYNSYCRDAVLWALENGVTTGTSDTTFSPEGSCTRGQVATFLWRSLGSPEPKTTQNPFTDIKETDYFYEAVLWAYENGVTTGTSQTAFTPEGTCTSAQVVTFLWRANGEPAAQSTGSEYYAKAVAWANAKGLLDGVGAAFAPDNISPRADIVTYLYRNANGK